MEALAGVNAALLTLYDLASQWSRPRIEGIRLLFKEGGKRGVWLHPDGMDEAERERFNPRAPKGLEGAACAVITLSDRASEGSYEDVSGPTLVTGLESWVARWWPPKRCPMASSRWRAPCRRWSPRACACACVPAVPGWARVIRPRRRCVR